MRPLSRNELAATMEEIMAASQQAAAAAKQSAVAVTQLRGVSQTSQKRTQVSLDRLIALQGVLKATVESMDDVIMGIRTASEVNEASAGAVRNVEQQAEKIREFIATMTNVASVHWRC